MLNKRLDISDKCVFVPVVKTEIVLRQDEYEIEFPRSVHGLVLRLNQLNSDRGELKVPKVALYKQAKMLMKKHSWDQILEGMRKADSTCPYPFSFKYVESCIGG